uniref:PUM-HD domain-containing protein n=1 Tax=Dracunculus medinensis TaxID=318479 RepID=A0A0N4UFR6_DRAME
LFCCLFQVPRKMKEKLLQMNGQQRRIYIKQFKKKRKANFDLTMRCKSIWEIIRRLFEYFKREKAISELYSLVKGKMKELIYAHDTSRVIECLLSFAGPEMKEALFRELIPEIIRMAKSKYARFFVVKMLKFGTGSQRKLVIESIRNHCVSLMRTTISASVLELIYNDYANAQQRRDIESEFYGKEYCIFDELAKQPNKIKAVVTNLYDNLIDIVTKPQLKLSLVHSLLQTFFEHCNKEERTEMIDSLKDHIAEIVHTNPGANVALQCIWHGTAKERKVIVKNFKGLVVKACKEKYGHHVLLGIFDSVDDTVKVNKYIVQEIGNHISEIISDKYGINVLHYLVHPRDPRYFSKIQIELLKKGDSNEFTKKPTQDRFSELFKCISKPLGKFMAANIDELISSKHTNGFDKNTLVNISWFLDDLHSFKRSIDDEIRSICYNSIATICAKEFIPLDMGKLHPIENSISHFVISKLLKNDLKCEVKLSASLAALGKDKLVSWVCFRFCFHQIFILLSKYLIFKEKESKTKNLIKAFISTVALKKYTTSGASVLLSKLSDA